VLLLVSRPISFKNMYCVKVVYPSKEEKRHCVLIKKLFFSAFLSNCNIHQYSVPFFLHRIFCTQVFTGIALAATEIREEILVVSSLLLRRKTDSLSKKIGMMPQSLSDPTDVFHRDKIHPWVDSVILTLFRP
jgi:hypothetical protein